MPSSRFFAILVAGVTVGTAAGLFFTLKRRHPPALPIAVEAPALPAAPTQPVADWCAPGYEAIAGGCLALPAPTEAAQAVVLYLHGRYAHDATTEEVDRQRRLAVTAKARGFAVLAVRGRMGECTAAELAKWYCWPSNEHNEDGASAVVATWAGALEEAHRRAGSKRLFVLGFSNGAYFAGLLAMRGLIDAEAYAIACGGPVQPVHALSRTPPLLLLSADDDIDQDDMIRLDTDLSREHWPHDSYARAGAHGLTDSDIDEALTFFTRAKEPLPLEPALSAHRPVLHAHEVHEALAEEPRL